MRDTEKKTAEQCAIIRTWQSLARINSLSFTTTPGPASGTGWAGTGHAEVICEHARNTRRFVENGLYSPAGGGQPLTFRNCYRWERRDDSLSLSHERFGRDRPVWLFDLVAADANTLTSATPHRCNADLYQARLTLTPTGFTLRWSISGPAKDETLVYAYRFADRFCEGIDAPNVR